MSENPNFRNFPPRNRPALEPDELDDTTLDEVVGGLMQSENRSYTAISNIMQTKHDTVKNSINKVR